MIGIRKRRLRRKIRQDREAFQTWLTGLPREEALDYLWDNAASSDPVADLARMIENRR